LFWRVTESRTAAGWLWEVNVLKSVLMDGNERQIGLVKLQSQSLKNDSVTTVTLTLPFPKCIYHGNKEHLAIKLIDNTGTGQRFLFVPGARNQATFDAFCIDGNQVTLFQASIGRSHSIKVSGLDFLWDSLNQAKTRPGMQDRIQAFFPKKNKRWRIVFIVPVRVRDNWNVAQPLADSGTQLRRHWDEYIEQYVFVAPDGDSTLADQGSSVKKLKANTDIEV